MTEPTIPEIIAQAKTIRAAVDAARTATEKGGKNPNWLFVARGGLDTALEQLALHESNNADAPAK